MPQSSEHINKQSKIQLNFCLETGLHKTHILDDSNQSVFPQFHITLHVIGLFSGVYRLTSDWNFPGRQLLVSQICWRNGIIVDTVQELIILWYEFFMENYTIL